MTPDYRAALERLVELDDAASVLGADPDMTAWNDAIDAARAALAAEPEAEGPSELELEAIELALWDKYRTKRWGGEEFMYDNNFSYALEEYRAALARWGRPAAAPVPETGEVAELVAELNRIAADAREARQITDARALTRAADLLQRQYPQPVAVSERWPEFSDCDPQERVWAWNPVLDHWKLSRINRSVHTHWLSAHALPTPEATND